MLGKTKTETIIMIILFDDQIVNELEISIILNNRVCLSRTAKQLNYELKISIAL